MRNLFFLALCFLGIFTSSCKKETTIITSNLIGHWNWVVSTSANHFFPEITPENTGIHKTFFFNTDGSYRYFENDTLKLSGLYHTKRTTNNLTSYDYFELSNDSNFYPFIIRNDSLIIDYNLTGLLGSGKTIYVRSH